MPKLVMLCIGLFSHCGSFGSGSNVLFAELWFRLSPLWMEKDELSSLSEAAFARLCQFVADERDKRQQQDLARFRRFRRKHLPEDMLADSNSEDDSPDEFADSIRRGSIRFVQKLEGIRQRMEHQHKLQTFRAFAEHHKDTRRTSFPFSSTDAIELF